MNAKLTERLDDFSDVANRRVSAFGRRDWRISAQLAQQAPRGYHIRSAKPFGEAIIYRGKNPPRLVPMTPIQSQTREVRCGSQLPRQCPLMRRQIKRALKALFSLSRFGRLSRHQNRSPHSKQFRQNEQIPRRSMAATVPSAAPIAASYWPVRDVVAAPHPMLWSNLNNEPILICSWLIKFRT
jgi:hypothetical protein